MLTSIELIRDRVQQIIDEWSPRSQLEPFEARMTRTLLELAAFRDDTNRVLAGERPIRTDYPLPLPADQTKHQKIQQFLRGLLSDVNEGVITSEGAGLAEAIEYYIED